MKTTEVTTNEKKQNVSFKKWFTTGLFTLLGMAVSFAQTDATEITDRIEGWEENIKDVLNAGVVAFAIVGGFIIFLQYMQGNDQAQKNFVKFVIGLAIFGLIDVIANLFLLA